MVMFIYFFSFFICVFFEPDEGPGSGSKRCFLLRITVDNGEPLRNFFSVLLNYQNMNLLSRIASLIL